MAASRPSRWTEPRAGELVDPLERAVHGRARAAGRGRGGSRAGRCSWSTCRTSTTSSAPATRRPSRCATSCRRCARAGACRRGSCCWSAMPRSIRATSWGKGDFDFAPTKLIDTQRDGDRVRRLVRRLRTRRRPRASPSDGCPSARRREAATVVGEDRWATPGVANLPRGGLFVTDADETGLDFEDASAAGAAQVAGPHADRLLPPRQPSATQAALLAEARRRAVPGELPRPRLGRGLGRPLDGAEAAALTNAHAFDLRRHELPQRILSRPLHDSLAESLIKAPQGGAVAVWASSTLTEFEPQPALDQEFLMRLESHLAGRSGRGRQARASPTSTRAGPGCCSATRRCSVSPRRDAAADGRRGRGRRHADRDGGGGRSADAGAGPRRTAGRSAGGRHRQAAQRAVAPAARRGRPTAASTRGGAGAPPPLRRAGGGCDCAAGDRSGAGSAG